MLSRQLTILKKRFPEADIVVVVGFQSEKVVKAIPPGIRIVENECYELTNVARSVEMGLRASSCRSALVVYGDLVFSPSFFDSLGDKSAVLVDTRGQFRDFEVGCNVVDGVVTHFSYGLDTKWAQVVLLTGRELSLFRRLAASKERRKHFGFEVLNEILEHNAELVAVEHPGTKVVEIDTSKDIEAARKILS